MNQYTILFINFAVGIITKLEACGSTVIESLSIVEKKIRDMKKFKKLLAKL